MCREIGEVVNIVEATCIMVQPRPLTKGEYKFLEIIERGYLTRNLSYSLRLDRYSSDIERVSCFVPEIFDTFEFIENDTIYSVENMLTWKVE